MSGRAAVLLLLVLLAGCSADPTDPGDAGSPAAPVPPPGPVAAIDPCPLDCYEPAIAIDQQGRVFVVAAHEDVLAVSSDGGLTYDRLSTPPLPAGAPTGLAQFDGTVAVAPDGRLLYYAFLASATGLPLPAPPVGLQVAVSSDAAVTWDSNTFLSALDGPAEPVVSPWKSWLGFAPDGTVYLDYNSRGSGLWVARSDDGGESWGGFKRVSEPDDRIISVFMGPPVVDSMGRLHIPYFADQTPGAPNPFLPQGHVLRVAVSEDRGETFAQTVVASMPVAESGLGYVGAFFPVLAIDEEDRMVLAHWDPQATMQVYASFDQGATWSGPVPWSGDASTNAAPWITVEQGRVSLLYYGDGGIGYSRGSIAQGSLLEPAERGMLVDDVSGGGDFVHFALDAEGRMVVPVPQSSDDQVIVVTGPDWPA